MKHKKLLPLLISIIMAITISLSGCSEDVDRDQELSEAMSTLNEDLSSTFNTESCDFSLLRDYIKSWSSNSGLTVDANSRHYIVISNPATEGFEKEHSVTMQCSIDTGSIENSLYVLATGMTSLLGPQDHGRISLIVTEYTDGHRIGSESVDKKYLNADEFINLQNSSDPALYTEGAYSAKASFSSKASKVKTDYTEAYTIKMSMAEYTDPYTFDKKKNYPDPVNTIGSLLATEKSSGKLFQIASFSCKAHEGYTPYTATVTVVIDSNNVDGFIKKFDNSYENVSEKFEKLEDDFVYTITKTELPSKVLSDSCTNHLISLMYTLNTGICSQDEDSGLIMSTSYINYISTDNGRFELNILMRARSEEALKELSEVYDTTAGLCSTKYSCGEISRIWSSSASGEAAGYFSGLVPTEDGDSDIMIRTCDDDFLSATEPSLNIVSYCFSKSDAEAALSNITHFIHDDESEE